MCRTKAVTGVETCMLRYCTEAELPCASFRIRCRVALSSLSSKFRNLVAGGALLGLARVKARRQLWESRCRSVRRRRYRRVQAPLSIQKKFCSKNPSSREALCTFFTLLLRFRVSQGIPDVILKWYCHRSLAIAPQVPRSGWPCRDAVKHAIETC